MKDPSKIKGQVYKEKDSEDIRLRYFVYDLGIIDRYNKKIDVGNFGDFKKAMTFIGVMTLEEFLEMDYKDNSLSN